MRKCGVCKIEKSLNEFYGNRIKKDGRSTCVKIVGKNILAYIIQQKIKRRKIEKGQ